MTLCKTIDRGNGVFDLLDWLDETDFYTAPASTKYHGAHQGGLLEHSLNVYHQMMRLRRVEFEMHPDVVGCVTNESTAIVALLHDVCKAEVYKEVEKFRKDKDGKWEKYKTYGVDYSDFPMGHGEKSVMRLLRWGLELTDEEMLAIRWHMGAFDLSDSPEARGSFTLAGEKTPLLPILIAADGLASHIVENK